MCVQPGDRHFEVVLSVITVGVEFAWTLFCDVSDEFAAVNTDVSLLLKNIRPSTCIIRCIYFINSNNGNVCL